MASENGKSGGAIEPRRVTVGTETYTIGTFTGGKVSLLMEQVASLVEAVPHLQAEWERYARQYGQDNAAMIPREEAKARFGASYVEDLPEEAFEDGALKFLPFPSVQERIVGIFPALFRESKVHLHRLLAVIALDSADIRKADEDGGEAAIDDLIEVKRRDLLYGGEPDELVELATAGYEIGRQHFAPLEPIARKGMLFLVAALGMSQEEESPSGPESSPTPQPSSTDSQTPTDGPEQKSSTASPTPNSEPSPVG